MKKRSLNDFETNIQRLDTLRGGSASFASGTTETVSTAMMLPNGVLVDDSTEIGDHD